MTSESMNYLFWSTINWVAFALVMVTPIFAAISAFYDFRGNKKQTIRFFQKSISLHLWIPVWIVIITRWLGINNGFFPT